MTDCSESVNTHRNILIFTLSISVSMGSFAMDIYIPFIPFLSEQFSTSKNMIQYTLSIFMVFMSLGQLIIGPISDQYGRKRLLLLSCHAFTLGSLVCALTSNIYLFLAGRALQATGACGGYAVSLACVRDSFSGKQSQKIFSYFVGINGLAPIIAPIFGTMIDHVTGSWRFCFHYLALTGVLSFYLITHYLQEPKIASLRKANWPNIHDLKEVFYHREFQRWFLVPCTVMTGLFIFFSISTHYVQSTLGYSTTSYSLFFGFNGLVYTLGSFSTSYLLGISTTEKIVERGIIIIILFSTVLCLHPLIMHSPPALFFLCSYSMAYIYGLILGPVTGLLLEPFSHRAGMAAALNGALQFMVAPIMASFFIAPPIESGWPYGVPLLILSTLSLYKIKRV